MKLFIWEIKCYPLKYRTLQMKITMLSDNKKIIHTNPL
ncbi:unnamed protein product [Larinioides sclopetarius]|uniref:Uncharacterized protein n=1 Tax=Larinioides sclopetarius TaxID=280406 RepID=A0AAV1ZZ85_9ARAC